MVDVKQENTRYVLLPVAEPEGPPSRTASYWACYFVVMSISFAGFIDYSVVMPSAQSYCEHMGQSNTFYGMSLSAYPLARIVFLPFAGLASDRMSMRLILAFTLCLQLIGGITYAIADAADTPALIIVGRLIAGIGSTNIAICQKFVISTSDLASRSKAIATMQAVGFVGIALGPALNFGMQDANVQIVDTVRFNQYTGAGFMLAGFHIFNLVLVSILFSSASYVAAIVKQDVPADAKEDCASIATEEQKGLCHNLIQGFKGVARKKGATGVSISAMLAMLWLSLLEALVSPVTKDSFGWSLQHISVFFAIFAFLAAILMVIVGFVSKCLSDRGLVACSVPLYGFATFVAAVKIQTTSSASYFWFYLLALSVAAGFTFQNSPSMSLFTKLMSGSPQEGLASSVALQLQGLGRTLGPLIAGASLDQGGIKVCAVVLACLVVLQVIVMACNWRNITPEQFDKTVKPSQHFGSFDGTTPMFLTPQTTPSSSAHSSFIGDAGKAYEAPAHDDLEFGLLAEDTLRGPPVDCSTEPQVPQLAGVWKHSHDDADAMDRILQAADVGYMKRKMFKLFHPVLTMRQNGDSTASGVVYHSHFKGVAATQSAQYKVGDNFEALDTAINQTVTYSTRIEATVGQPIKLHQFQTANPERGLKRWVEHEGGLTMLIEEVDDGKGNKAKRFYKKTSPTAPL